VRSWHSWRWRVDSRLIRLLLLLHQKLALLHLLQHLLRSFHAGLVRRSGLFGLRRALVRAVIRRVVVRSVGFGSIRRVGGLRCRGCIVGSRSGFRIRRVRCLGYQHNAHQGIGVCR